MQNWTAGHLGRIRASLPGGCVVAFSGLGLWWVKVEHLGVVFIPTAVLIFTLAIVQRVQQFRVVLWGSLAVSGWFYLSILSSDHFIAGLYRYDWGYDPRDGPLGLPFRVFFFCLLLGSLFL
jgi:hypothetical protein